LKPSIEGGQRERGGGGLAGTGGKRKNRREDARGREFSEQSFSTHPRGKPDEGGKTLEKTKREEGGLKKNTHGGRLQSTKSGGGRDGGKETNGEKRGGNQGKANGVDRFLKTTWYWQ